MATPSKGLENPWTEEPGGLQSIGSQTVWVKVVNNIISYSCKKKSKM